MNCKLNYNNTSSILTFDYVIIASMENMHLRIKEVMDEKEWGPPDVARICGLKTPHAIYQWMDGTTKNLKQDNLYHFCQAAEIHMEWLISGEHPKYKPKKLRHLEANFEKMTRRDQDFLCSSSDALAKPSDRTNGTN